MHRSGDRGRARFDAEFRHDITDVRIDGALADEECLRDLYGGALLR